LTEFVGLPYLDENLLAFPHEWDALRLYAANFCDSASLVRAAVFEEGHRFDQSLTSGLEDWSLFLRLAALGHLGVAAGDVGFRYRRDKEGMSLGGTFGERHYETSLRNRCVPSRQVTTWALGRLVVDAEAAEAGSESLTTLPESEDRLFKLRAELSQLGGSWAGPWLDLVVLHTLWLEAQGPVSCLGRGSARFAWVERRGYGNRALAERLRRHLDLEGAVGELLECVLELPCDSVPPSGEQDGSVRPVRLEPTECDSVFLSQDLLDTAPLHDWWARGLGVHVVIDDLARSPRILMNLLRDSTLLTSIICLKSADYLVLLGVGVPPIRLRSLDSDGEQEYPEIPHGKSESDHERNSAHAGN
jgi:hypothetical protein